MSCLIVFDAGAPVDSKYIDIQPTCIAMTEQHIIAASEDTLFSWQYRTSISKLTSVRDCSLIPRCCPLQMSGPSWTLALQVVHLVVWSVGCCNDGSATKGGSGARLPRR